MNGNDAMVLTKNGVIIDVIGRVGEDPASGAWTADPASGFTLGTWWTAQHTLKRKSTVKHGDNNGLDLFNPSLEWDSLPVGSWNDLGVHSCDCTSPLSLNNSKSISYFLYPNPTSNGGLMTIKTNFQFYNIELINIIGEKVLTTNTNQISTSNLPKGVYFVRINFINGERRESKVILE